MANTFKNAWSENVPASQTDIYTVSSGTTVLIGLTLTNTSANDITATVELYDHSASTNSITFLHQVSIPKNTALEVMRGNKIVLETNDKLQVTASATSSLNVFASVLEIT